MKKFQLKTLKLKSLTWTKNRKQNRLNSDKNLKKRLKLVHKLGLVLYLVWTGIYIYYLWLLIYLKFIFLGAGRALS